MLRQAANTQKSKEKLKKSAYMLATVTFCAIGIAFAWFTSSESAKTLSLSMVSANGINCLVAVSADNTALETEYSNLTYSSFPSLDGLAVVNARALSGLGYLQPDAGDGVLQLYEVSDLDETPVVTSRTLTANTDYLELDVYLKSSLPGTVYLSADSWVNPVDADGTEHGSTYGNFSKDYLAAATRVSVAEVGNGDVSGTESLKLLWAPNKNVELTAPEGGEESEEGWTLTDDGTPEREYRYWNGNTLRTVTTKGNNELDEVSGALFYTDLPARGVPVGTLVHKTGAAGQEEYLCHLRLRVWVEATDREAKAPLSGGQFTMGFTFESVAE